MHDASVEGSAVNELERAIAQLSAGDDAGALASLVDGWRKARVPELANLIDMLSTRLDQKSRRPKGKSVAERHEAWLALAGKQPDPANVAALLATFDSEGQRPELRPKLDAIAEWPHDPRVAVHLMKMVTEPRLRANDAWSSFWTKVLDTILATGDTRVVAMRKETERLFWRQRRQGQRKWISQERLNDVLDRLERQRDEKRDAGLRPLLSTLRKALEGPKGTKKGSASELYRAVYANPDDDTARSVLADVLQELGDPRGELIALQLSGKNPSRAKKLLKEHAKSWIGPLASIVVEETAVFERGFLDACAIACRQQRVATAAMNHPEWATVREVSLFARGPFNWEVPLKPLLYNDHTKSLRAVRYFPMHELEKLGPTPLRLTKIHVAAASDYVVTLLDQHAHLFPNLRSFDSGSFSEEEPSTARAFYKKLLSSSLVSTQIETLASEPLYDTAKLEFLRVGVQQSKHLKELRIHRTDDSHGWEWSLSRDTETGKLSVLEGAFVHKGYRWKPWQNRTPPLTRAKELIEGLSLTSVRLASPVALADSAASLEENLDAIRKSASTAECTFEIKEPSS